jgi:uncharacterized protein with GYD domain
MFFPIAASAQACSLQAGQTAREHPMATYILLANFTVQGLQNIAQAPKRIEAARALARECGCAMKETYWVLGQHDIVCIFEAPDDESMAALSLSISRLGDIRTQTLHAFSEKEIGSIIGKVS